MYIVLYVYNFDLLSVLLPCVSPGERYFRHDSGKTGSRGCFKSFSYSIFHRRSSRAINRTAASAISESPAIRDTSLIDFLLWNQMSCFLNDNHLTVSITGIFLLLCITLWAAHVAFST